MSVAEHLRTLRGPDPDVDFDRSFDEVRRRARAHRRRRDTVASLAAVAVVAVVAVVGLRLAGDEDRSTVDTVDSTEEHVRVLPGWVPDGFRLAYVDLPADSSGSEDLPLWEQWFDYAFGYVSDRAELQVNVYAGERLDDPDAIAAEWQGNPKVTSVNDRPALYWTDQGNVYRLAVEVEGAVVEVVTHPYGETVPAGGSPGIPSSAEVERFAASIAPVTDGEWDAVLSDGVDVASTFGPKDGTPVIEGDEWTLMLGEFRAPVSVRHPAFWVDINGTPSTAHSPRPSGSGVPVGELTEHDGTRVAWGLVPSVARTVTVTVGDRTLESDVVAAGGVGAFAVAVGGAHGVATFDAFDRDGRLVASAAVYEE